LPGPSNNAFDRIQMQRHFFASPQDCIPVFEAVEAKRKLQYTRTGLFHEPPSEGFSCGAALPTLFAYAPFDLAVHNYTYLVTLEGTDVTVRAVPQRVGGTRYAVDQLANPDSITFTQSVWQSADVMFCGCIATASSSAPSKRITVPLLEPSNDVSVESIRTGSVLRLKPRGNAERA
jgi:hypothetical protein